MRITFSSFYGQLFFSSGSTNILQLMNLQLYPKDIRLRLISTLLYPEGMFWRLIHSQLYLIESNSGLLYLKISRTFFAEYFRV